MATTVGKALKRGIQVSYSLNSSGFLVGIFHTKKRENKEKYPRNHKGLLKRDGL